MEIKQTTTFCLLIIVSICYGDEQPTTESLLCVDTDDNNISCVTDDNFTTEAEITTTDLSFFLNDTFNVSFIPESKHEIDYNALSNEDGCLCDLQVEYCDINCCCDKDCSPDQKLVFSECELIINNYDTRYCHTTNQTYYENSLFCIVKSNLPKHYIVQNIEPIVSINKAQKSFTAKYKWPKLSVNETEFEYKNTFKYGDKIWINSNSEYFPLHVSDIFLSNACFRKKYVRYLKNMKSQCSQMFIDETNTALSASTYFENITIVSNNITENNTQNSDQLQFTAFLCNDNLEECEEIFLNDTRLKVNCQQTSYFSGENQCNFLTEKVKYIFHHNGTFGITSADVYLSLKNLTFFINTVEFVQTFQVIFTWANYSNKLNYTAILSGKPGYLIGKPILFSYLNDTLNNNDTLCQNDFDVTKNVLSLPENVDGYCKLDNRSYNPVEFGFNIRFECNENYVSTNINLSATEYCIEIQKQILVQWQIEVNQNLTESRKYVGMFGNANKNRISEWIQILYDFNETKLFQQISGTIDHNYLTCKNVGNILKINFIYVYVDLESIQKQAKIISVVYNLDTTSKLLLNLNYDEESISTYVHLVMEVMFFDDTMEKQKKYVDLPTLQIKLPDDFFYPFTFGKQNILTYNYYLITFCIYVYLII